MAEEAKNQHRRLLVAAVQLGVKERGAELDALPPATAIAYAAVKKPASCSSCKPCFYGMPIPAVRPLFSSRISLPPMDW